MDDRALYDELAATWPHDSLWPAWMASLKGGTYAQGFQALLRHGMYCPMGVLCSIVGLEPDYQHGLHNAASFAGVASRLPYGIAMFLNITPYGHFKHAVPATYAVKVPRVEYPAGSIVSLNDTAHWSFVAIADYLIMHRSNLRPYGDTE